MFKKPVHVHIPAPSQVCALDHNGNAQVGMWWGAGSYIHALGQVTTSASVVCACITRVLAHTTGTTHLGFCCEV